MPRNQQTKQPIGDSQARKGDHDSLSVIIVTYQNAAEIGQCLRMVDQATPDIPMDVIIVDNASADDTVAVARRTAPNARIIEQSDNCGFAAGCAAGAAAASGRWLLFLNPDAVISLPTRSKPSCAAPPTIRPPTSSADGSSTRMATPTQVLGGGSPAYGRPYVSRLA